VEGVEDVEDGEREEEDDEAEDGGRRALLAASSGGGLHCPRRLRPSLRPHGFCCSSPSVSSWTGGGKSFRWERPARFVRAEREEE